MDRRGFLAGVASIGAIAGLSGLVGCAPSSVEGESNTADPTMSAKASWETPPEAFPDDAIAETVEVDVVVVGAGMAGMAAFMYAAEAGANVVIVEKRETYSGRGLDFAAIDTKVQKEAGVSIDKGKLLDDLVKSSGFKASGSLLRLWADHSGEVFDRLIDMTVADGGQVVLGAGSSASADAEDFTTRTYPTDHMFGGLVTGPCDLIGRMEKAGIAAGGQSLYNTKAEQLERDEAGKVSAVVATKEDGSHVRYKAAKGVILATGDYANNPEMVEAWCPLVQKAEANVYPNPDANVGDGINMALWVGGTIQPGAHAAMVHPIFGGGALCAASYLKVNGNGKRFCNESTTLPGISNMYMTSPGNMVWTIFDNDFENQMPKMSPLSNYNNSTAGPLTKLFSSGAADPANPPSNTEVVEICLDEGTTLKADSIEELASIIDVPADVLEETIDRYNKMVDAGSDEDFGKNPADLQPIKNPPFYASALTAKVLVIASGLNVNDEMQVLDKDDRPIEGLFAVGNVMGNFFANDYPICAPGLSHGRCLTLGALIGQAVATGGRLS